MSRPIMKERAPGHAHGVGVQRCFKICNAKYSARTVNLKATETI